MWQTGNEKFDNDLRTLVRSYPGVKVSVGPIMTSWGGEAYTSDGPVVWVWLESQEVSPRMFSGMNIIGDLAEYLKDLKASNVI